MSYNDIVAAINQKLINSELFTLEGHPAVKSYQYDYWDWIYRAYSLYPGPIQQEDPVKIVGSQKR